MVASPNVNDAPTTNTLSGVSCVSPTDCWAVGWALSDGAYRTLTQRWDGISWATVGSPNPGGTRHSFLYATTCVSASDCWAVGYSDIDETGTQQTLIEHWNGSEWTIMTSPELDAPNSFLTSVTCASATDCWIVGAALAEDPVNGTAYQALIARWDGSTWEVVDPPTNGPTRHHFLYSVTCTVATDCWAVGYQAGTTAWQTLAMHWDGTNWSIVNSPSTGDTESNYLFGVACTSRDECWAAGLYTSAADLDRTLLLRWDGSAWTVVDSPNGSATRHSSLFGISCSSPTDCHAVGYAYYDGIAFWQTLVLRWDGTTWTLQPSANTSSTEYNIFYGVACPAATECWGIGFHSSGTHDQTLVERWDGSSWSLVTSPNNKGVQRNSLNGVTCVTASDCWAVGSYRDTATDQSLVMRWDGTDWTVVTSPNTSPMQLNVLRDVACVSASECWAVGNYIVGFVNQTLILRWDGSSWDIAPSPNTSTARSNLLKDVTCVSASECWAVGDFLNESFTRRTLAIRWDGTSWSVVGSPNTSAEDANVLSGMTCVSTSDCWAVGHSIADGTERPLIMRWNGTEWVIVTSPNIPLRNNVLTAVACVSTTDCWAVGHYYNGMANQTLILHWDGVEWSLTPSPNTVPISYNYLTSISCPSTSECWAAGYAWTVGASRTMLVRWDGTSWAFGISANSSEADDNQLNALACVGTGDCWAIGYHNTPNGTPQTLALNRVGEGSSPEPTPTPTPTATATASPTESASPSASPTPPARETQISFTERSAGSGQYGDESFFEAVLADTEGEPLGDEEVAFELSGADSSRTFSAVTDAEGRASVAPVLSERPGSYQLTVRYEGSDDHDPSADTTVFLVEKEDSDVQLSVEGKGTNRTATARLSDRDTPGSGIAGRTIHFYADGEFIGTATTDEQGTATLKAPSRYRGGKHDFEARFEGDDYYNASAGGAQT